MSNVSRMVWLLSALGEQIKTANNVADYEVASKTYYYINMRLEEKSRVLCEKDFTKKVMCDKK